MFCFFFLFSTARKKSEDDQLKRDLSADSGYRTIRRCKTTNYPNQNVTKVRIKFCFIYSRGKLINTGLLKFVVIFKFFADKMYLKIEENVIFLDEEKVF